MDYLIYYWQCTCSSSLNEIIIGSYCKKPDAMGFTHRRLCRVKNMLAMYLKYHKAGLTPTTPVKMSISAFRSFSSFIIALRNVPEKFRKKSSGNVIIYQYCYCIISIPRSTEVFIHFVSHILAPCNVSSV